MNRKLMLTRLVENALDFLDRAIDDLEKHPKFSLINFYTAVELFLKARLMMEHWTLVVTSKQEPDLDKFAKGDFQSVTLDGANDRLIRVVRSGLSAQEIKMFKEISTHRNQMVHFFHVSSAKGEAEAIRRSVARQQLTAWYVLHRIISVQWKPKFANWDTQIAKLDKRLRKQKEYLKIVFEQKSDELKAIASGGAQILSCPSCGFKAQAHQRTLKEPYDADCIVCGLSDTCVIIECDGCTKLLRLVNDANAICKCGQVHTPGTLADALTDTGAAHVAAMEGDDSWNLANCAECDGYHTVVRLESDRHLCTECFGVFDDVQWCGWCNEPNTGDMDGSEWNGCNFCDGRSGWDRD